MDNKIVVAFIFLGLAIILVEGADYLLKEAKRQAEQEAKIYV